MKHFLPVFLFALSFVVFSGCGNQGGNANDNRTVERPIGHVPLVVATTRNDMNEKFSLTMHVVLYQRDARAFERQYERYVQRIIERVEMIMIAATPEERTEVGFATIKEKSQQAINEILGTPLVQQVIIITDVTNEVQEP